MIKFVFRFVLALGLIGLGAACSSQQDLMDYSAYPPPTGMGSDRAADIVRAGDRLEIYVLEDESFNGIYLVRDGGHVIFPRVGRVEMAGKGLSEAEAAIKAAFEGPGQQLKQATVIVERHSAAPTAEGPRGVQVYLNGAVNNRGAVMVPYINDMRPTAYQAIVHAGGFSDWANRKRVHVIRREGGRNTRIELDMRNVGTGAGSDLPLREGDIIVVPEKTFGF